MAVLSVTKEYRPDDNRLVDAGFQFCLLGPLQITNQGEALAIPPYRTHRLLAALLLNPHPLSRCQLIGLLFLDNPERNGRCRLSDLLWLLRRALPSLPLHADAQELYLPRQTRWLDVEAFQQAAHGNHLSDWLEAAAIYRGPLLENIYDDWLLVERERFYLTYLNLLHCICETYLQQNQFDDVLPYAERLVQTEPYDERALRVLLQTYQALGRRGAALAAYDRFVALLTNDLNADPEPATTALADAIRTTTGQRPADHLTSFVADDNPVQLLRQARTALAHCDQAVVRACLRQLRRNQDSLQNDIRLIEIDLALLFEDHAHAAQLLQTCSDHHVSLQVRAARLLLAQRNAPAACNTASEALMLAHQSNDQTDELSALLVLAQAQQQLGQSMQSMRIIDQALRLARHMNNPQGTAQALILKGTAQLYQGRYDRALPKFYEAQAIALEHRLPYQHAVALGGIHRVLCHTNRLCEARAANETALAIWRDLGLLRKEAVALEGLLIIEDLLGNSANSLRILEQLNAINEQLGDPVRLAVSQYHLASSLLYLDDDRAPQAITAVNKAIATFQTYGQAGWAAAALTLAGYALWVNGQYATALTRLEEAYQATECVGELASLPELLAYQGLACLGLDRPRQALAQTHRAVLAMAQGEVSQEVVHEIYYAHAMALFANSEMAQGKVFLQRAFDHLLTNAADLADDTARQAFFRHNPTTRRLMQELYSRNMTPPPTAGVVSHHLPAIKGSRTVSVHWTVDAGPADTALKRAAGPIALRRSRLNRLLQEVHAQGAQPTVAQLAAALNVSKRTIQRDLAFLRQNP